MITLHPVAIVAASTADGTASQEVASTIKTKLCQPVCVSASIQPVYNINYYVKSVNTQGTTTFVVIKAEGNVSYVPKGCTSCQTRLQSIAEEATLIFDNSAATGAPTVSIETGESWGLLTDISEERCDLATGYSLTTDVTVTADY